MCFRSNLEFSLISRRKRARRFRQYGLTRKKCFFHKPSPLKMGIPSFFRWLVNIYPSIVIDVIEDENEKLSN